MEYLFAYEHELRDALLEVLQKNRIQPFIEIPFLGRSLDVVYRSSDETTTVIEVKRLSKHIRRALDQAKICLLGADKVYVCTQRYNMGDSLKSAFLKLGIGLMFLHKQSGRISLEYAIPPAGSERKRNEYATMLNEALERNKERRI